MSNDVTLTIDGVEVTVPAGTLIVEAAKRIENEIPVFCYHGKMDPVGMCRMCLVEAGRPMFDRQTREPVLDENGIQKIQWERKPITACTTPVSPGMVVKVNSEAALADRKAVLEFLLTSHPLDCPVCDKGGECPLQDLTVRHGPGNSRFDYEDKQHFPKKYPLGDLIVLDMERCIICARCTRFQSEIAHDPVLAIEERGRYAHIVSYSNPSFDSHYSGNTTDICPVGALTTRDFRFAARAWELTNTPSLCNHCGVGCNTVLATRTDAIKRIMPRQNELVNEVWICDKGRFAHHFHDSENRLTTPLIRKEGQLVEATWAEALALIAEEVKAARKRHGNNALGGVASARLSNEDLYLFQKFFRRVVGSNNVDHHAGINAAMSDDTAYTVGVGNGTDLSQVGKGSTILVIGADLEEEAPILYLRVAGASCKRGATVINAGGRRTKLDAQSNTSLRYEYGTAAHLVLGMVSYLISTNAYNADFVAQNVTGFDDLCQAVQKYTPAQVAGLTGIDAAAIETAAKDFAEAENGIIIFGMEAGNDPALRAAIEALALITGHVGKANNGVIPVLPHANSRGAEDMGVVPDRQAGYVPVEAAKQGLSAQDMLAADSPLKWMLLAGVDPIADGETTADVLKGLEFLVVQDLFLTETAKLADVVLPTKAIAERDGSFTNIERRVQTYDTAIRAPSKDCWADWLILSAIAGELGAHDWLYASADGVMAEITKLVPLYKGMEFKNLVAPVALDRKTDHYIYEGMSFTAEAREGVQWATQADKGAKIALRVVAPAAPVTGSGFTLATPRFLYDNDRLLTETELLHPRLQKAELLMSKMDAKKLDVRSGDVVTVSQNGTSVKLPVQVNRTVSEGLVLVGRNLAERPAEKLVGPDGVYTKVKIEKR